MDRIKIKVIKARVSELLNLSIENLIKLWNETNKMDKKTLELAEVRGWIMDALEAKNLDGFNNWIDACADDPTPFFLG